MTTPLTEDDFNRLITLGDKDELTYNEFALIEKFAESKQQILHALQLEKAVRAQIKLYKEYGIGMPEWLESLQQLLGDKK